MKKTAHTDHPINDYTKERWSPRAFSDEPVKPEDLASLLEAARWAPSAMNEQPWRFFVGIRKDATWLKINESLMEGNRVWAKNAPVLMLVVADSLYSRNKKKNASYAYDAGQAVAHLTIEATRLGLFVHQMGGFDKAQVQESFQIPEQYHPMVTMALGYYGTPDQLSESLKERELAPRVRHPHSSLIFADTFGKPKKL